MKKLEKVILLNENQWGPKFSVKSFKTGFVINYLLPKGEALIFNKKNVNWIERLKNNEALKKEEKDLLAEKDYQKIHNLKLQFTLKRGKKDEIFASINFNDILEKIFEITQIQLNRGQLLGFSKIEEAGNYSLEVKIAGKLAKVNVSVE